jgi:hypothetical protein
MSITRSFSVGRPTLLTALLKYEVNPEFCREQLTLLAGDGAERSVVVGQLLGLSSATAVTVAAAAGNTGNGAFTLADPAIAAGTPAGNYEVICIAAAANGGTFEIFDPSGVAVGTAKVGVAYAGALKFTIADGAADFVVGDSFTVTVPAGTKAKEWDPAAIDGSAAVAAIVLAPAVAADGADSTVLALSRGPAIITDSGIAWPDGVTDDQKAGAIAALAALAIIVRET